jgi:hypothetical protein
VAAIGSSAATAAKMTAFESVRERDMSVLSMMAEDQARWHTPPTATP